ncbi:MAG: peptidase M28 family protein [Chryseobacterium sp.]|nr:MAG: peptidase M28 family protein [Chryseobacterium sp.]
MKKLFFLPLVLSGFLFGQDYKSDSVAMRKIADHIMTKGEGYNDLYQLTKQVGHRLSGSEGYSKAVKWAEAKLKEAGADRVWLQPVKVPVWVRGEESLQTKTGNGTWQSIPMLSLGNSEGTNGKVVEAEVIVVRDFDEFDKLTDAQIKGKIVLFNYPMKQELIETGEAYGDAGRYRYGTASLVAKRGGRAVLVRSISTAPDDVPHTGAMSYDAAYPKIPAVAIGPKTADELQRLSAKQKIYAKLVSNCGMRDDQDSFSVIGEIAGTENGVIVVGGHLDSWDVGEGAQDDGAGVVQSIEVLRLFKQTGLKNKHTIRAVLFANEENGTRGGKAYADYVAKSSERHVFAIESDTGGYSPRGFGLNMDDAKIKQVQSWQPLFVPYGVYRIEKGYAGADINPLQKLNVPLAGLQPDSQRYFDLHHSHSDVFEAVNRRELLLGATVMAQLIYLIDNYWK